MSDSLSQSYVARAPAEPSLEFRGVARNAIKNILLARPALLDDVRSEWGAGWPSPGYILTALEYRMELCDAIPLRETLHLVPESPHYLSGPMLESKLIDAMARGLKVAVMSYQQRPTSAGSQPELRQTELKLSQRRTRAKQILELAAGARALLSDARGKLAFQESNHGALSPLASELEIDTVLGLTALEKSLSTAVANLERDMTAIIERLDGRVRSKRTITPLYAMIYTAREVAIDVTGEEPPIDSDGWFALLVIALLEIADPRNEQGERDIGRAVVGELQHLRKSLHEGVRAPTPNIRG